MAALRSAATLAHVLPTLRLRIRRGAETLLEIGHPSTAAGPVLSPCAFRRAVAGAHGQAKQGLRPGLLGLPADEEPAIDVGVRGGDATLPGGVYRVTIGEQTIHGFVTTLSPSHCRAVLEDRAPADVVIRLRPDPATEVTFVHTVHPTGDAPSDGSHLQRAIEALLADEVVHELVGHR